MSPADRVPADRLPATARRRLRVVAWRARRPLAALCAGLAVLLAVDRLRPPEPATVAVPVAARDLEPGTVLTDADVVARAVPVTLVPPGLAAPGGDVLGRRTAVALPAGLAIAPQLLADEATTPPEGTVVVPVRFADAGVAGLLRPGTRVDVVAAALLDGGAPERLAAGALVLAGADPPRDRATGGAALLGGTATAQDDAPVLLAVTPEESAALGAATASRVLGAVIVG